MHIDAIYLSPAQKAIIELCDLVDELIKSTQTANNINTASTVTRMVLKIENK